jgi:hypothetical protein
MGVLRGRRLRLPFAPVFGLLGLIGSLATSFVVAQPSGAVTPEQLKAKVLSVSDMPSGWSVDHSTSVSAPSNGCLTRIMGISHVAKGLAAAQVTYTEGISPTLQETLVSGRGATHRYNTYNGILNDCRRVSGDFGGTELTGTVGAMSLQTVGDSSRAFAINLAAQGVTVGIDIVLFRVGQVDGDLVYEHPGPPATSTVQTLATIAVDKIEG